MQAYEYERMRAVEDGYWWYQGLHHLVRKGALGILRENPRARILDAGCGTGGNMRAMRAAFPDAEILGVDIEPRAVEMTRQRGVGPVLQGSVEALPFAGNAFDLVVSLDVLCTKGVDDRKALRELHRVLKEKGVLLINLAAFEFLKGSHDLAVHAGQRYTKGRLCRMLLEAGFDVVKGTYWNSALFPFLAFWRPLSRVFSNDLSPRSDLKPLPSVINGFLTWWILRETDLARRVPLPVGSSVFVTARKR